MLRANYKEVFWYKSKWFLLLSVRWKISAVASLGKLDIDGLYLFLMLEIRHCFNKEHWFQISTYLLNF